MSKHISPNRQQGEALNIHNTTSLITNDSKNRSVSIYAHIVLYKPLSIHLKTCARCVGGWLWMICTLILLPNFAIPTTIIINTTHMLFIHRQRQPVLLSLLVLTVSSYIIKYISITTSHLKLKKEIRQLGNTLCRHQGPLGSTKLAFAEESNTLSISKQPSSFKKERMRRVVQ